MYHNTRGSVKLNICNQYSNETNRNLNPQDIILPPGYTIEVYAKGLDAPSSMDFTENGDLIIGESGYVSRKPAVLRLSDGRFDIITEDFETPITGITYRDGDIYVSQLGKVTVIKPDGTMQNIISGLPSFGDYWNSGVTFGADNKMYFGQGTATNSGVVGIDNTWTYMHPYFCDYPGSYIMLNGQNFETRNIEKDVSVWTGAFSPYSVPNMPYEVRKGILKASGCILRANPDGTEIEQVAWGFRHLTYAKFDQSNRLFVANQGYDVRGSRPIANAPDEFHQVTPELWYGWPDYAGGEPVTLSRFRPEGGVQPQFLLTNHPDIPPNPYASFPANAHIAGFDFNYNIKFGPYGDVYIAEFGAGGLREIEDITPYTGQGHRISRIDMRKGGVTTFAMNKSGFPSSITQEGGFGRPVSVVFGPDGAMYVLDFGTNTPYHLSEHLPNTGVIWKITKL